MILDNYKFKLIGIPGTLKVPKKRIRHVVQEYLDTRELCVKWTPRELTIEIIPVSQINENEKLRNPLILRI